jgi:hypothetical protein
MAVEAIQLEDTDGLGASLVTDEEALAALGEALARTGPVRFEDYYAMTTRFEVVDQAAHFLMVRSPSAEGSSFSPEVYSAHAATERHGPIPDA